MTPERQNMTMDKLIRYGIEWQGPELPICKPMPDGLWTEWHVANAHIEALTTEVERKDAALQAYLDAFDKGTGTVYVEPIIRAALQPQEKVG